MFGPTLYDCADVQRRGQNKEIDMGLNTRAYGLAISLMVTLAAPAFAQDAGNSASPPAAGDAASSTAAPASPSTTTLTGGVKKVDLSLEKLRDVGLDLKRVMTGARHLYDEVSIQPVTVITEPEVVGRGMIINIPIGTRPVGPPQPPRKDRVDLSMNDMRPVITILKKNADDFVADRSQLDLPADIEQKLNPLVKDWISGVDRIAADLKSLDPLTTGPNYDNASIAAVCTDIQKNAKGLDEARRKVYKIMKKEDKRLHEQS
jgi:hypothetical protein